jgi:hypothetical protein
MNKFRISNLVLAHPTFLYFSVNAKSNCPSKGDAIHQLKKISQKGKHWIALTEKKITTVKHLLRQYHKDKTGLQKVNMQL